MSTDTNLPLLPELLITDTAAEQEVIAWFEMICSAALHESSLHSDSTNEISQQQAA